MIAVGILITWLTLTAAGFAGLSALDRAGAREGVNADLTLSKPEPLVLTDTQMQTPKALTQ